MEKVNGIADQRGLLHRFFASVKATALRIRPLMPVLAGATAGGRGEGDLTAPSATEEERRAERRFDFASILRLRTFVYLFAGTVFLVLYINNILTINELSRQNEVLREKIGISKSINTTLEVELQELHTIHRISGQAETMGLRPSIVPAVKISAK